MTIFLTALKRICKQPLNWVFVLLFPAIFAGLLTLSNPGGELASHIDMCFGVADQDQSALSKTLVKQLKLRYTVVEVEQADIPAALTDADMPWALVIPAGYGRDVLAGRAPALEGYSLAVSDVSALGSVTAENITRALLVLGTDDAAALAAWEEAARVEVTPLAANAAWELAAAWMGFFGFVTLFTAYFIVKTLSDDKRGGMPDRLGVLPAVPRRFLLAGTLAAFAVTEITALLLLGALRWKLGEIPHAGWLFALLSLYNLFSVALVLAVTSIAKTAGVAAVALTMCSTFFSMLGGLFWPLSLTPPFMRKVAWFSPGYWLGRGLENIRHITFEGYVMPMLFLAGFTLVALLLGGWKKIQPMED